MALVECRLVLGRDCGWRDDGAVAVGNVGDVGMIGVVDNAAAVRNAEGAAAGDMATALAENRANDVCSIEKGAAMLTMAARTHNAPVEVVDPSVDGARVDKNDNVDDCSQS